MAACLSLVRLAGRACVSLHTQLDTAKMAPLSRVWLRYPGPLILGAKPTQHNPPHPPCPCLSLVTSITIFYHITHHPTTQNIAVTGWDISGVIIVLQVTRLLSPTAPALYRVGFTQPGQQPLWPEQVLHTTPRVPPAFSDRCCVSMIVCFETRRLGSS